MTINFELGAPSWAEIGSTDVAGTKAFYGALFGWTVEDLGPEAGGYGFIRKDGKQVAGIGPATDPERGTSWAIYFATDDADATTAKVEANGGKVVMPPGDVMDAGRMAVLQDPAGAYFSIWQAGNHRGAEILGSHGAMNWVELLTSDIAGAKAFYPAVFPVTTKDMDMGGGITYTTIQAGGADVAGAMAAPPEMAAVPSHWSIYFGVDDCWASADQAIELGATELMRDDAPPGRLAILMDPQGGKFCMIQPNPDFAM